LPINLQPARGGKRGYVPATTDRDAIGVHSLDQFVLTVPDLGPARRFYGSFGLDVRENGERLAHRRGGSPALTSSLGAQRSACRLRM